MEKQKDVGAIWVKSGQYGEYLSISLEIDGKKLSFVAYPNKFKEQGDNKPSYRIPAPKLPQEASKVVDQYQDRIAFINAEKARIAQKNPNASYLKAATITDEDVPF